MKRLVLSLILVLLSVASARAATVLFTDATDFKTALGSFTVYDFDAFILDEGPDAFGFFKTLDQQIPDIDFDNSRVNLGAFGGTSSSPPNVVLNADFVNPIVISFSQPQRGVGLFNTSLFDAERFQVFDSGGGLLGSVDLPDQVVNFGGFISDEGISRAEITPIAPTNGSIFIDDLIVRPVPLPSTLLMFVSALGALVTWRRV